MSCLLSLPSLRGSVNEYQLQLGRQRQVWLIPIAEERVGVQVKVWNPLRTRVIPERFCGGESLWRGAISSVCTFTFFTFIEERNVHCGSKTFVFCVESNWIESLVAVKLWVIWDCWFDDMKMCKKILSSWTSEHMWWAYKYPVKPMGSWCIHPLLPLRYATTGCNWLP